MIIKPLYSLTAVRALALYTQGLTTPPGSEQSPTPDAIYDAITWSLASSQRRSW